MNDLEISLFQMTSVGSGAVSLAHYASQGSFTKKKKRTDTPGEREDRGMAPPSPFITHPHTRDSTNVTSCLCHRADFIVVSDWL